MEKAKPNGRDKYGLKMRLSLPVPAPDQAKKVTSMKKHIIKYLHFTLGCFIMALAINVFLVQHHFLSGGIAGLAMLIYYIAGFPMGITSFLLNVPLFYMAYKFMSRKFLMDSLIGTALFSIFLDGRPSFPTQPMSQIRFLPVSLAAPLKALGRPWSTGLMDRQAASIS